MKMMTPPEAWVFLIQLLEQGIDQEEAEEKVRYELRVEIAYRDYSVDRSSMDDHGIKP